MRLLSCPSILPLAAWINENINGLIRQFLPKGSRLEEVTGRIVKRSTGLLNRKSGKSLKLATPTEMFGGKSFEVDVELQG